MSWLIYNGQVIASIEERKRGFYEVFQSCGRKLTGVNGVIMTGSVFLLHNIGSSLEVDIIILDEQFSVKKLKFLKGNRFAFVGKKSKYVLLGSKKSLAKYNIQVGDILKIVSEGF